MHDLLAVLGEPNRRRLLELLLEGEQPVVDLASHFGVTRSAISQHLGVLERAGLVEARKQGRYRYYRVRPAGLAELHASLDVFWSQELDALAKPLRPLQGVTMPLDKSVLVPLGADETFALLTEPERLRRWQAVAARIDLRAGGEYRWTIVPGHTAAGKVVEVEPGRRLVISWGWEDSEDLPPGASTVTVTLEPADGGTVVRLVHEGLTDDQAAGHLEGWTHYLDRLATAARDGDAGADAWAVDPGSIDQLTAAEASLALCQLVLRGVDDAGGVSGTPCAKYNVDQLVDHLIGSVVSLGGMAGADIAVGAGGTYEERVADVAQSALEAWRRRGTAGEVEFGGGSMPAEMAASILALEFLVHAWDFAQASSQPLVVSEGLSGYVLGAAQNVIAPSMRDGDRFADIVELPADAGDLDRLVAFTGRQP